MNLAERLHQWFDAHGPLAFAAAVVLVALVMGVALVRRFLEPSWTPEQLWKLKQRAIRLFEDTPQGLRRAEVARALAVAAPHLQPLLEELIQDRFLVAQTEGGDTVYRLKRFAGDRS